MLISLVKGALEGQESLVAVSSIRRRRILRTFITNQCLVYDFIMYTYNTIYTKKLVF